jgi:FHS family L-fucose permease-like MFS transporter
MIETKNIADKRPSRVLAIILMFALFFMIAFVTAYQTPLGRVIKNLSNGDTLMSQLGMFANFIGYAVMGYPAGVILQRHGYRITALVAVTVGFFGVLITFLSGNIASQSVFLYLIGAFVAGFSMCMLNAVVNPMLNGLGKNQNQGNQLVQLGGACNSLSATLTPVVVGYLMGGASASSIADANQIFFLVMVIFAVAFLILLFSRLPEDEDLDDKEDNIDVMLVFRNRNFTLGILAIFIYVGIEVGISYVLFQYMTEGLSISESVAGTLTGTYWLMMFIGRLCGGAIGAKVSSRAMLIFVSIMAMAFVATAILLPQSMQVDMPLLENFGAITFVKQVVPVSILLLVLCGLFTSVMWGTIFNLSVAGLGKYVRISSGIFMVMVCGGGIIPLMQSTIAEQFSYISSFWLIFALLGYILFYALYGSRVKNLME